MMLFPPPEPILAPTSDGNLFPVRRLFCIGRNYAAHAREMGKDPVREAPFFFTKWAETVVLAPAAIAYPPETANYHYEAELVLAIGKAGRAIPEAQAGEHIYGYATGLDMTRRDLQAQAKDMGRPWSVAKNVEQSAPLGLIHPRGQTGALTSGSITLSVNGAIRQAGDLDEMIWNEAEVVAYVSRFYQLEPGDLIYTGTPAGVGAVVPGDVITVSIAGLSDCTVTVEAGA